jgi:uncharacterized membrane protein YuzA (DUF378 family)
MKKLDLLAVALLIVGGLNWGLVSVARFDLVASVFGLGFGETNAVTRIIYGLVGVSAVYVAAQLRVLPRRWTGQSSARSSARSRAMAS